MKKFVLAASACLAAMMMAPAASASVVVSCPSGSGQAFCTFDEASATGLFGNSYKAAQAFTDIFIVQLTKAATLSITMTNTAATGGPISFSSAELIDNFLTPIGPIAFGAVPTTFDLSAGFYGLRFIGSTSSSASYGGTIDVNSVPEPATWGMMMLGLGIAGMAMRRRATKVSFA